MKYILFSLIILSSCAYRKNKDKCECSSVEGSKIKNFKYMNDAGNNIKIDSLFYEQEFIQLKKKLRKNNIPIKCIIIIPRITQKISNTSVGYFSIIPDGWKKYENKWSYGVYIPILKLENEMYVNLNKDTNGLKEIKIFKEKYKNIFNSIEIEDIQKRYSYGKSIMYRGHPPRK